MGKVPPICGDGDDMAWLMKGRNMVGLWTERGVVIVIMVHKMYQDIKINVLSGLCGAGTTFVR